MTRPTSIRERVASLEAQVVNLADDIREQRDEQRAAHAAARSDREKHEAKLDDLAADFRDMKSQAAGGWKVLVGLSTISAAAGAFVMWVLNATKLLGFLPR